MGIPEQKDYVRQIKGAATRILPFLLPFTGQVPLFMYTLLLLSVLAASAAPFSERDAPGSGFVKQNGLDAQQQNAQFLAMKSSDACQRRSLSVAFLSR